MTGVASVSVNLTVLAERTAHRTRWHTDDSIEVKYYDRPANFLDKMAFSFTGDLGCESGSGVSCFGNSAASPKQSFVGGMLYNRFCSTRTYMP